MSCNAEVVCPFCGIYFEIDTSKFWINSGGTEETCPRCKEKIVISAIPLKLWEEVMPIDLETGELEWT